MGFGMTTLPTLLVLFLVTLFPVAPLVALYMMHQTQTRLLRIFSEKQGIPVTIMESKTEHKEPAVKKDTRPRISVPLPGSQIFKKTV